MGGEERGRRWTKNWEQERKRGTMKERRRIGKAEVHERSKGRSTVGEDSEGYMFIMMWLL